MSNLGTRHLERLPGLYPTVATASMEVIDLEAILNLSKRTEYFLTDIRGEYEAFSHVLKDESGAARRKVNDVFGNTLGSQDKQKLATLIYYPREKIAQILDQVYNREDWYKVTLYYLIEVSKRATSKYIRSKVRRALPPEFAYVIEELIAEKVNVRGKESCYSAIVRTIIRVGRVEEFIVVLYELIQRLIVNRLHTLGDIYDRGLGPHIIMDKLMSHHSLDIQWGNHDVLQMGIAMGQRGCIANAIHICTRYGDLDILESGYGVSLLPLATFTLDVYGNDPCTCLVLRGTNTCSLSRTDLNMKMHKVISIIQFKMGGQLIKEHPELELEARNLLHLVDFEEGTICLDGKEYQMTDYHFPTVDPADPYRLTEEEEGIIEHLVKTFANYEKLQQHMRFLLAKSSLYKVYNGNLLCYGCIPLNEDGSFKEVEIYRETCKGKALHKRLDSYVRKGFMSTDCEERKKGRDIHWCIRLHQNSPLFGEDKMVTFERYFLTDKETHREKKNPYYSLLEDETTARAILDEFGLSQEGGHIINGHVPVKSKNGENPVRYGGKVLVIDGGFSRAYQRKTGITGYTLSCNSYGLILAAHGPFEFMEAAIKKKSDIHSESIIVKRVSDRKFMGSTGVGCQLKTKIRDLEILLEVYHTGKIAERFPVHQGIQTPFLHLSSRHPELLRRTTILRLWQLQ